MDADDSGEDEHIVLLSVESTLSSLHSFCQLAETTLFWFLEETGWKLVHGDVFRKPPHSKACQSLIFLSKQQGHINKIQALLQAILSDLQGLKKNGCG